jgi:hypothetical protein
MTFLRPALCLLLAPAVAAAQPAPAPRIEALAPDTLAALAGLSAPGAAALVFFPDGGPQARTTVAVRVDAPLASVRAALLDAARWPEFMPALTRVEQTARFGRRAAYRFDVAAGPLTVHATTAMTERSARRVDLDVDASDFGPAGARWELLPQDAAHTLLVLTSWSDPAQGHWLLRQAASSDPSATAGMNVAVDLTLALALARRARDLAGTPTAARPEPWRDDGAELAPPAPGPWMALHPRYYTMVFALDPGGAVRSINVTGQTFGSAAEVVARVRDVAGYRDHLPGVRQSSLDPAPDGALPARGHLLLRTPFDAGEGDVERRLVGDATVFVDGRSGELAHSRWRWDVTTVPARGTFLSLTGVPSPDTATLLTRAVTAREPFLVPGVAALRQLVWLRHMLAGIRFA